MQSVHSDNVEAQLLRVVPVKLGDLLCYPPFKCIHLNTPNRDQLKKDLARYRQKEIMIQLCNDADNYSSTYEELHSKLFAEQKEGIRLIWEYVNMMYQDYDGEEFLKIETSQLDNFKRLSEFYGKFSTLPLEEEKAIIGLFRFYLGFDNFYEECNQLELNKILAKERQAAENTISEDAILEERINEMEIEGSENIQKLFISPVEKFVDEFTGSVKELRCLFKIPRTNTQTGNLHQQICNTAKRQFEETNGDCCLFGLDFTKDEQILNWIHRTNGKYRKLQFPKTIEGMMAINSMKKSFNFLKSLDIAAINTEIY